MLIRFNEISPQGNRFTLHDVKGLEDFDDIALVGRPQAEFLLQRKGDAKVEMKGQLDATVMLNCDRCLKSFEFPVKTDFHILFEIVDESRWNVKEMECSSHELDTILLEEPQVDVDDTLCQQLLLALPDKKLCSVDCKGICSSCGMDLNVAACICSKINPASPFAVLGKLKR